MTGKRPGVHVPLPVTSREVVSWGALAVAGLCGTGVAATIAFQLGWLRGIALAVMAFVAWVVHKGAMEIHEFSYLLISEAPPDPSKDLFATTPATRRLDDEDDEDDED